MAVKITIKNAKKIYGNKTVIENINLEINPKEFFTLLGPSGCGKTTLLRMIAGFNSIEGGDFLFDNKRINDLNPEKRNIGMVFQNYAIFPHLTVRKNVEFGLTNKKLDKTTIKTLTDEFMKLMHIEEYQERMPDRLSGGQQQRVALARALVIKPDVLLMDEPLSNLDAKLRVEMRSIIKKIQKEVGITNVYVTHDQEEAMAVSDRIAVMNLGEIQQITTPKNIYQRPANVFVANFIGRTNLVKAKLICENNKCYVNFNNLNFEANNILQEERKNQDIIVAIRPEDIILNNSKGIKGIIDESIFLGLNTHYYVNSDIKCLEKEENGDTRFELIEESQISNILENGKEVYLDLKMDKINIFTSDGSKNIVEGVINDKFLYTGK